MALRDDILSVLTGDTTLMTGLPGGIHTAVEISRQYTPAAFDANTKEILACGLLKLGVDTPSGPYHTSSRQFFNLYVYQRRNYDAIDAALDRAFVLLHEIRLGNGVWQILWANDVRDQQDDALDCSMSMSTYQAIRLKGES